MGAVHDDRDGPERHVPSVWCLSAALALAGCGDRGSGGGDAADDASDGGEDVLDAGGDEGGPDVDDGDADEDGDGSAPPPAYRLLDKRKIADNGGRPNWSPTGDDLIAFDRKGADGYYDLWLMNADGTGQRQILDPPPAGFPARHVGNPSWHPSGAWIAVMAEKQEHPGAGFGSGGLSPYAEPGMGFNNDLWVVSADGTHAYLLWENPVPDTATSPQSGLLVPRFSHDGTRIAWTHIYRGGVGPQRWGDHVIRVADFSLAPTPHVDEAGMRELDPFPEHTFKEAHGWSPDDTSLTVSGNWRGQSEFDMDIGILDLATGEVRNLTPAPPDTWTEAVHLHPSGGKVFYMSSEGYALDYGDPEYWTWLATDYWMIDPDGGNRERITFFNDPGHPDYAGTRVNVAQFSWNPAGTRFAGVLSTPVAGLEVWVYEFGP